MIGSWTCPFHSHLLALKAPSSLPIPSVTALGCHGQPRGATRSTPARSGLSPTRRAAPLCPCLPSMWRCRHGHTAVMEVLVEHGAKTNSENKQGLTAMGCALLSGHVPAAKLLQG